MWSRLPETWKARLRDARAPFLLAAVLAAFLDHDWDGYVFRTVTTQLLAGISPYAVAAAQPATAFLGVSDTATQWWAYPPLMLLAMAATYWPATLVDLAPFLERLLWKLPMVASLVVLAWVAGAWARRFGSSEEEIRRVEKRFLWNPYLLLVAAAWGMTDVALMAFYLGGLLAYGNGKSGKAGLLVGLAFLVKPFPAFLFLPIAPYLVRRHGWGAMARFAGAAGATVAAVSLPFALADPVAFFQQVVGMHLARGVQGLTLWNLVPRDLLSDSAVKIASPVLMVLSLAAVGLLSARLKGKGTTLMLTLLAGIAVLVWNRVVNEQYLVMVVAPILILDQLHILDRFGHFLTRWTPILFACVIALRGFHFVTFVPADVAVVLFARPADQVAEILRQFFGYAFWWWVEWTLATLVSLTLFALSWLALRILRSQRDAPAVGARQLIPTAALGLAIVAVAFLPALGGAAAPHPFIPATPEPRVAAFHYVWWQNPAHDPEVRYGNWGRTAGWSYVDAVSQVPEMGYYTSTRAVAREQVATMLASGIDTAIVSFHLGEEERYRAFQEEAADAGLRVAPLIELNQLYDQPRYHPVDERGTFIPAAFYRLDNGTRDAIVAFVLALKPQIVQPSTLRLGEQCPGGCPTVYFYDSYVSGVSFHPEDKRLLAATLLDTVPLATLREAFRDPTLQATVDDLLRHHPPTYTAFNDEGSTALWRQAHLVQHVRFWGDVRERLERELGTPLFLVNGDALNERAAFQAGTVKSIASLDVFDGSFIYSPSFTWGNQPRAPFEDTFALWEDRNVWLTALAAGQGRFSSFGIAPAYDDTVNRDGKGGRPMGFTISPFPDGEASSSFYERSWDAALAHPPTLPAVATYNEYFEGSSIEPSREYGDRFLLETLEQRGRFEAAVSPSRDVAVMLHERSSRTSLLTTEMDESHFWGLGLLSAAGRAVPDARLLAFDAQGSLAADLPELLLLEGGRGPFAVSVEAAGVAEASPTVLLFGPDVAQGLGAVPPGCLGGLDEVSGLWTLESGDRLRAESGTLRLQRDGVDALVGQRCGTDAATSVKPWVAARLGEAWGGAYDQLNAQCLAVTLRALQPAFAAPDAPAECVVP